MVSGCLSHSLTCFASLLKNELKNGVAHLPPTKQTSLATNQVVASYVNTDFWGPFLDLECKHDKHERAFRGEKLSGISRNRPLVG